MVISPDSAGWLQRCSSSGTEAEGLLLAFWRVGGDFRTGWHGCSHLGKEGSQSRLEGLSSLFFLRDEHSPVLPLPGHWLVASGWKFVPAPGREHLTESLCESGVPSPGPPCSFPLHAQTLQPGGWTDPQCTSLSVLQGLQVWGSGWRRGRPCSKHSLDSVTSKMP